MKQYEIELALKIRKICDNMNTLRYEIIEHEYNNKEYNSLNILSKKSLVDKLKNTAILLEEVLGNPSVLIIEKDKNIDNILKAFDRRRDNSTITSMVRTLIPNKILGKGTVIIRLLDRENNQIDLKNINKGLLESYMNNNIIQYIILNKLPLPEVDLKDASKFKYQMLKFTKKFSETENNRIRASVGNSGHIHHIYSNFDKISGTYLGGGHRQI